MVVTWCIVACSAVYYVLTVLTEYAYVQEEFQLNAYNLRVVEESVKVLTFVVNWILITSEFNLASR